jgi:hypothetical protein
LSLWKIPPLGIPEKTVALNPGTARRFARGFRKRTQAAYSRYRVSIPGRVKPEHRGELAKVNGAGGGRPKKLNVLYGSRHILSTRSGCLAADAKLYPVLARVVGCAHRR